MKTGASTWAALAAVLFLAAQPAVAGDYDGSKPLICAALVGVSCQANGQCKQDTVEKLNIPQFFWIDAVVPTARSEPPRFRCRPRARPT